MKSQTLSVLSGDQAKREKKSQFKFLKNHQFTYDND